MGSGKIVAGIAAALVAAEGVMAAVKGGSSLLRPPGSQGESDFMSRCIKCGKCLEACPHAAIRMAGPANGAATGTPIIEPRTQACRLCEDFPCVNACPTEALRNVATRSDVDMGYAKIDDNLCIAFKGMRCEICYRACPLIDKAIKIDYQSLEGDTIHAKFVPVIQKGECVGCGLCVQRCVVDTPRVAIKIVSIAEQGVAPGTHKGSGSGKGNGSGSGSGKGNGK